ncbi:GTPase activating protein (Gyp3), putative [Metarhizium acridum CQMa 102]|uniref:GTPase activating protein (Gyp3), putative n=1 Tax=Metarhizium acridum (strain CQMa 102) TaxID=655827 RepID=E9DXB2_METAQ|nr:GTPase activating protein (Gyp3), putative [Metarhizium acridum CQMa 102]EFY91670.1 GTPase activating protein (Gyp3), putative [Metarhizium acridum CQMa 102]
MDSMAVPQSDEEGPIPPGQHTVRNRKCSLYASRIKPLTVDTSAREKVPQLPEIPPLPVSPRWDSLSHGLHLLNQSPISGSRVSPTVQPEAMLPQPFPPLAAPAVSPSLRSPRSLRIGTPEPRNESPCRSIKAKTSLADMRSLEGIPLVENFSRPRKQSIIRQAGPPESLHSPDPVRPRLANMPNPTDRFLDLANPLPQTPPWQRPRRPSASSVKSSSTYASPLPYANSECIEPRHRARNVTGPPALTAARTPAVLGRPEYPVSTPLTSPGAGGTAPWLSGDELRSSFRSQLTASTTPGTAVTERSSVLTKDSSVTSLENPDEPSLEDVMGMYEKGFADDEDENESDFDDPESEGNMNSRPMTAVSEPDGPSVPAVPSIPFTLPVAERSLEPQLPTARSTLDTEIRQSKMIFTSPAFTASVAAIAGKADVDMPEKRDSAKSLDSEPSTTSDSAPAKEVQTTVNLSSPAPEPALPTPTSMPVQPEDPGSRDRYGFKKANQSITREQYDAWNAEYSVYIARRRRKWVAYLKDCALMTDRPIRFPSPNAKTKRFVRKGIPPDWRGAAWFYYAGGPAILAKHAGLYERLLHKSAKQVDVEAIERDLHRTFPDNIQFKPSANFQSVPNSERSSQSTMTGSSGDESAPGPPPAASNEPPIITSLRRVLHAFSIYNPRIGYCQSLNFLAGLLLLFVETEEQCFWLLNVITIIYLPGTHDMSLEGSKVDLGVLMTELRDTMPAVWDKIGGELENLPTGRPSTSKSIRRTRPILRRREQPRLSTDRLPPITLCMTAWFMSCYIGTLPIETTLRVWDVFFYEGSKTLFRIALAIFKTGESEIKAVKDPMEMFGVVQAIPRRMLDANALMEACFKRRNGFGHLSQGAIDERRQERRQKAKQELEQSLQQRDKTDLSGNLTEVESGSVSRKGTLFGRKMSANLRAAEV